MTKMNAQVEPQIIQTLYEASCARCAHRPDRARRVPQHLGLPGVSRNFHVRSIVGCFFEHARAPVAEPVAEPVAACRAAGVEKIVPGSGEVLCASAD